VTVNANNTGTVTISGGINNTGAVINSGSGAATVTFSGNSGSGGVGSLVTSITQASNTSALTLSGSTGLILNTGGTTLTSTGSAPFALSSVSGSGNLLIRANATGNISISGSVTGTGSVTNSGSGANVTSAASAVSRKIARAPA
jgi:hypothetical protein